MIIKNIKSKSSFSVPTMMKKPRTKSIEFLRILNKEPIPEFNTSIENLNDYCLLHIFTFLPMTDRICIQRVCKHWQEISKQPWTDVKYLIVNRSSIEHNGHRIFYELTILKKILELCGTFITYVKFHLASGNIIFELLSLLKEKCPSISSFSVESPSYGSIILLLLSQYFTKITRIYLKLSDGDDYSLAKFFYNNKNLEYIEIVSFDGITGSCFQSLHPNAVKSIVIDGCKIMSLEYLIESLPRFKNLLALKIYQNSQLINGLNNLLECVPQLRNLTIHDREMVCGEQHLISFPNLMNFVNLRALCLRGERVLHNGVLIDISDHCKELSSVTLICSSKITDSGLGRLTNSPKLEYLEMKFLDKVTDECFIGMKNLITLNCSYCSNVGPQGILSIMESSKNLDYLGVMGCEKINNKLLIEHANKTKTIRVKSLTLSLLVPRYAGYGKSSQMRTEMRIIKD